MTATGRKRTRIVTGLHPVSKRTKAGLRWYIYAWRGGPQIAVQDGERAVITLDLIKAAEDARRALRRTPGNSVRGVIEQYKDHKAYTDRAKDTKRDYNATLGNIEAEFGDFDVGLFEDIRIRADVDEWRKQWAHQPRTADKHIVMLNTLLNWAKRERGLLATNQCAEMTLWHSVDKSDEVWEDRHWQALEAANIPAHIMRAIDLGRLTGLRISDMVQLSWEHVFDKAIIITTEKRKVVATVPIFGELKRLLDELRPEKAEGAVLLNTRGKRWTKSGLQTVWQKVKPEGFDRTIHDMRGTFVTWLCIKGLNDREIADIIGWKTDRIAQIRARYVDRARVVVSIAERLSK